MKPTKPLTAHELFFFEHASYSHGPDQTTEEGRTQGAIKLAAAEHLYLEAHRVNGVELVWGDDAYGAVYAQHEGTEFERCESAWLRHGAEGLASLGGILDADMHYRRVVRAELASECLDKLRELGTPYPEVPNMDGMSQEDLILWASKNKLPRTHAKVIEQLRTYAVSKAAAMTHREMGNLAFAEPLEALCERIYQQLPEWARW